MTYRPEIDGLRALAVLSVLLFHLDPGLWPGGWLGVDVFFVISGYLITGLIVRAREAGRFSFRSFYWRRLRRLAPALLVTLILTLLGGVAVMGASGLTRLSVEASMAALYVSNVYYFLDSTNYFHQSAILTPLLHTWSLGVEEQFYLAWPALIFVLTLRRTPLFAVFFVLMAASFWLAMEAGGTERFYLTWNRVFEFAIGAALAVRPARLEIRGDWLTLLFRIAGLALILAAMGGGAASRAPGPHLGLIVSAGTALVLLTRGGADPSRVLTSGPVRYLGRISYSLYLVHWPLISLYFIGVYRLIGPWEKLGLALVCLGAAAALYHAVEAPFRAPSRHFKPPVFFGARPAGAMIAGGMLAILLAGVALRAADGWPQRVSPEAARFAQTSGQEFMSRFPDGLCGPSSREIRPSRPNRWECWLGDETARAPDVVLLGDSHARALSFGLGPALADRGLRGLYIGERGTLALADVVQFNGAEPNLRQAERYQQHLDWTIDQNPDLVILAGRWTWNWTTSPVGMESNPPRYTALSPDGPLNIETSQASLRSGLTATLSRFREAGIDVIVMGTNPHLGADPVACADRPVWLAGDVERQCVLFTAAQERARHAPALAMLQGAVQDAGHGEVVDILPLFCDGRERCRLIGDEGSLYMDDDHLSPAGAGWLVEAALGARLDALSPGD